MATSNYHLAANSLNEAGCFSLSLIILETANYFHFNLCVIRRSIPDLLFNGPFSNIDGLNQLRSQLLDLSKVS